VFPSDGSKLASPETQISFRGVPKRELDGVEVEGSKSGSHDGKLRAHSDGRGASFVPEKPFADGERVTVRAGGARQARFSVTAPVDAALPAQHTGKNRNGVSTFRSRPDLEPSALQVSVAQPGTDPGHIFLAPKGPNSQGGPMILDPAGKLVWFRPMPGVLQAYAFEVQRYRGKPVLAWWQGEQASGIGQGEGLVFDTAYRAIARIRAGNGYEMDLHEFQLTDRGTALIQAYNPVRRDLTAVGGARDGLVFDGVVQEIDVKTGLVLFEWHSLDHVPISHSYTRPKKNVIYDYFHVNSIDELPDNQLLLGARDAHTVYAVDRATGKIAWRVGGKHSDFDVDPAAAFRWQHDARWQGDDQISLFNNNSLAGDKEPLETSGLVIRIDRREKRATLVRSATHPEGIRAPSKGSMQVLSGGGSFVGWGGKNPRFSEFSADGTLLFDELFLAPNTSSYRGYRSEWSARPADSPAVAAETAGAATTVYASWNGATEIDQWRVLSGDAEGSLSAGPTVEWSDFETEIALPAAAKFVQVEALDASGKVIGRSKVVAAKPA
jgi:hypothetical protein